MTFPSYTIAIMIILVILSVSTPVYFIYRKRKRGSAVGAAQLEVQDEDYITEKNNTSPYAVRSVMQYTNSSDNIESSSTIKCSQISSASTIPTTPVTPFEKTNTTTTVYKNKSLPQQQLHIITMKDNRSSIWTATDNDASTPPPAIVAEDFKINLPLPPPNASFFSDKMELDSIEANDLYASYMNVAAAQQQQDFVSIDLDDKPFLSNAAANIQQKAATLGSTLRQSIRRKSIVPKAALSQFFGDAINSTSNNSSVNKVPSSPRPESTRMSRQSSSTSSKFPRSSLQQPAIPPSPRPDSPASASEFFGKFSNNSNKKSLVLTVAQQVEEPNSNKIMIDDTPTESYFSFPISPSMPSLLAMKTTIQEMQLQQQQRKEMIQQQQEDYFSIVNNTKYIDEEGPDKESENGENNKQKEDAALAARRLIRSASRKSRTRSTIITEEAAKAMLAMNANNTPSPSEPIVATKYAKLRKHNMEIDTSAGSMRRKDSDSSATTAVAVDIRKWSNNNDSPSSPSPKRAIVSSTLSGSATVSGKKMAKQQPKSAFNNSSDNLLGGSNNKNEKSITLGQKSGNNIAANGGPKSLRNLFTRPSMDEASSIINNKEDLSSNKSMVETDPEDNNEEEDKTDISVIATPSSPVTTATAPQPLPSPYSSKNNTLRKMGTNVDTIRRMLQSSWSGNNLKESGSINSLSSSSDYMGSVGSSYRPIASPLGSVNPRLQNQHLVSLSLKANISQQTRSRPSMPIGFMDDEEISSGRGPVPTASFSSSTVRTMIPADEEEVVGRPRINKQQQQKSSVMGNLLGSRQPRQPSKLGDSRKVAKNSSTTNKKLQHTATAVGKKTPAQIEREKYLKSLKT